MQFMVWVIFGNVSFLVPQSGEGKHRGSRRSTQAVHGCPCLPLPQAQYWWKCLVDHYLKYSSPTPSSLRHWQDAYGIVFIGTGKQHCPIYMNKLPNLQESTWLCISPVFRLCEFDTLCANLWLKKASPFGQDNVGGFTLRSKTAL